MSLKNRVFELLPNHSNAEICQILNCHKSQVSKFKAEFLETCSDEMRDQIAALNQSGKSRKPKCISDEMAKLYNDQSLTIAEISRLLDISYSTAQRQMRSHGYNGRSISIMSQIHVIDRRAWLQRVGYAFEQARLMQPDYVPVSVTRAPKKKTGLELIKELAIQEGKAIVDRNPFLYRKWGSV